MKAPPGTSSARRVIRSARDLSQRGDPTRWSSLAENALVLTGAAPADLGELRRVRDRMAARGPDGAGEWVSQDGRVALGHRRLSIIDLRSVADQPMRDAAGDLTVVFNGELYGYRALRAELVADGAVFRTQSDTEILLHLWRRRGPAMLERLRGMYAFEIGRAHV